MVSLKLGEDRGSGNLKEAVKLKNLNIDNEVVRDLEILGPETSNWHKRYHLKFQIHMACGTFYI